MGGGKDNFRRIFGRDGIIDSLFFSREKLVPVTIRKQMAEVALRSVTSFEIVDGGRINLDGPGITEEDKESYYRSVAELSTGHFFADSAVHDVQSRDAYLRHLKLLDELRVKQESTVLYEEQGIQPSITSPSTTFQQARKNRRDRERRKKEDETRNERIEAAKPFWRRKYD